MMQILNIDRFSVALDRGVVGIYPFGTQENLIDLET